MPGEAAPGYVPSPQEAAMMAKVDAQTNSTNIQANPSAVSVPPVTPPAPGVATRPETVPEKFWDAAKGQVNTEALLASYTALEAKAGTPPVVPPVTPPVVPPAGTEADAAAAAAVASAKLDMSALSAEYATTGTISEANYAALAAAGFDKGVVDGYIQGQMALAAQRDAEALSVVGGQEAFNAMQTWANASLTAADHAAFNAAMAGTPAQMAQALTSLKARYESANGRDPKLLGGSTGGGDSVTPFASRAEVTTAMRDPKYKNDPAYREMVQNRIGLMDVF